MTFPVTKRDIREALKAAKITGEQCLVEFLDANKKGKNSYCINWAAVNLCDVRMCFDEDAEMTLLFEFDEAECHQFNAFMAERLRDSISGDYRIEVISQW